MTATSPRSGEIAGAIIPFAIVGTLTIVAGGLIAAVSRPTGWIDGPWVAAYLVLVSGVGQIALGAGQAVLAAGPVSRRRILAQALLFNCGSALVIGGTLLELPLLVTGGGVVLLAALVLFVTIRVRSGANLWLRWGYLGMLIILLVSIPVGLALSWIRA
ncbi:MAG: hypothetical protein ACYC2O_13445 [Microthrixaceae bacterium]